MKIGFVGLGKLGLPVALALERAGHEVCGWDRSDERLKQIRARDVPEAAHEPHLREYLEQSHIVLSAAVYQRSEVVMVCVQTPHQPEFEGITPLDRPPEDFDYTFLRRAVEELAADVRRAPDWDPLIVIVSTCLPGTFEREIRPLVHGVRVAYHPLFIAMGSVIEDFRDPEFLLFGRDDHHPGFIGSELCALYGPVLKRGMMDAGGVPIVCMSIASAELTKVAYNAFIGYKLMLANGIAMTSDAVGANCDDVMGTLKMATKRLVSTAYLTPGMGDGGGCHPRDQIALSWMANELDLPHDPYREIIRAREAHAKWLTDLWLDEAERTGLQPIMLGTAYKANSTLQTGSQAFLMLHYAVERGHSGFPLWDTVADMRRDVPEGGETPRACYFLGMPHDWIMQGRPTGVMIDPWGLFPDPEPLIRYGGFVPEWDLKIIRPGRRA